MATQHYTARVPAAYVHRLDECIDHFLNQGLELVDVKVIPGNFVDGESYLVIFKRETARYTPIAEEVNTNWLKRKEPEETPGLIEEIFETFNWIKKRIKSI